MLLPTSPARPLPVTMEDFRESTVWRSESRRSSAPCTTYRTSPPVRSIKKSRWWPQKRHSVSLSPRGLRQDSQGAYVTPAMLPPAFARKSRSNLLSDLFVDVVALFPVALRISSPCVLAQLVVLKTHRSELAAPLCRCDLFPVDGVVCHLTHPAPSSKRRRPRRALR